MADPLVYPPLEAAEVAAAAAMIAAVFTPFIAPGDTPEGLIEFASHSQFVQKECPSCLCHPTKS